MSAKIKPQNPFTLSRPLLLSGRIEGYLRVKMFNVFFPSRLVHDFTITVTYSVLVLVIVNGGHAFGARRTSTITSTARLRRLSTRRIRERICETEYLGPMVSCGC
jgi:hypothetical protein